MPRLSKRYRELKRDRQLGALPSATKAGLTAGLLAGSGLALHRIYKDISPAASRFATEASSAISRSMKDRGRSAAIGAGVGITTAAGVALYNKIQKDRIEKSFKGESVDL